MNENKDEKKDKKERLKPISLYPLEIKEALEDLLKIRPFKNKRKRK